MTWHIARAGATEGPYSDEELGRLVETGHLKPDDLVWKPGLVRWTLASNVPGLLKPPLTSAPGRHPAIADAELPEEEESWPSESDRAESATVESPLAAHETAAKPRRRSYLARHWRGELSLPVSYWVNGCLVSVLILAIVQTPHGIT